MVNKSKRKRIKALVKHRKRLVAYLVSMTVEQDFHAVSDTCCDIREVDSELDGLRW